MNTPTLAEIAAKAAIHFPQNAFGCVISWCDDYGIPLIWTGRKFRGDDPERDEIYECRNPLTGKIQLFEASGAMLFINDGLNSTNPVISFVAECFGKFMREMDEQASRTAH